ALQQFFQKAENKAYTDTLQTFYRNGDRAGYEAYLMKIKPEVEKQVGIKVDREFSPEMIQAYTTAGGAPHLDGGYTVFGKVIKGFEVIDKIASQPRDEANRPVDDVWMVITVEELPLKKIEKLYNYKYPEVKK
ncbi:MAG TPA: peptidylprolyl isomerase, partial [Chryseosolibacter sp.]|nr:peptidylprolyl isomerase [Chryseosolibacter sp.]